jgi:hypothetical protein
MKSRFSIYFSMVRSPNRVLTPLKGISKILISSFVNPSKIFVWEGYTYKIRRGHFAGVRYCAIFGFVFLVKTKITRCNIATASPWATCNYEMLHSLPIPNDERLRPNERFRIRFPGKHFSTICSQNRLLAPLKSASQGNAF